MLRRLAQLLQVVLVLVLAVVVALGTALAVVAVRGIPQRSGTAQLPGLAADVSVERDASGITQIYAGNVADLFAAQGYVHASERMWQMEVWRHLDSGTLSELFGASELDTDRFVRTLGWRQAAERDLQAASPEMRAILQAYASGVNAWLDQHRDGSLPFVLAGFLGAGGGLAGYRPARWTAVDSLAWAKVMAWQLGGNLDTEVFNLLLATRVDPAAVAQLSPPYRSSWPVIVPTGAPGSGGAGATAATAPDAAAPGGGSTAAAAAGANTAAATASGASTTAATASLQQPGAGPSSVAPSAADRNALLGLTRLSDSIGQIAGLTPPGGPAAFDGIGSNDWVVAPSRSASGHAILANDPHLGFSMPSIWYMNGLHCAPVSAACPYDVAGVSFPGAPGVVLGHNARIAWGFTNVNPDVQDLFAERVDPSDPTRYEYEGKMLPFTVQTETIKVAGGPDVQLTIRSTVHGPVISDVLKDLLPVSKGGPGLSGSGVVYALRWTATAQPDHTFESILRLDRASNFQQFRDALRLFGAPSQNVVYADVDGNIGYQMPGLVPIRKSGVGSAPVPGWTGAYDWTGYVPFDKLPYLYDPPGGVIVTANNAVVDSRYPYLLTTEWGSGYRAQRILQLIEQGGKLTPQAMVAIQGDTYEGLADDVVPFLAGIVPATADGRLALDRIRQWDHTCPTSSLGCTAFMDFEYRVLRDLFDPRLGSGSQPNDIARLFVGSERSVAAMVALLHQPDSRWWDDPATPQVETRDQVLAQALDQAGADLRAALGDPAGWTWGSLHTVEFDEQSFGASGIPPFHLVFDRGPYPVAGAPLAVDQTAFDLSRAYPDPYQHTPAGNLKTIFAATSGPSYRFVVDTGDLDGARIVITTGQSGVPFDTHYGDLIDRWLADETVTLPFSRPAVDAAATQTLRLAP